MYWTGMIALKAVSDAGAWLKRFPRWRHFKY